MTRTERKQIAAAFRACLPCLWDGKGECPNDKTEFICWALEESRHEHGRAAQWVVMGRLCGCGEFSNWLFRQIGVNRYAKEVTPERLQAHRRAWVRKLIKEFES